MMHRAGATVSARGSGRDIELLVRCVRTAIGTGSGERIREHLGEDIDWTYVVQTALQHGVMPLLYRSLSATFQEAVPTSVLDRLRGHFRANAEQNLFLAGELLELLALFDAHRVLAISLKGPILAASVYGNLALRQFADLDIFVPADQVARARDLLIARGYRFRASAETYAVAECPSRGGQVRVDLQWALAQKQYRSPLDLEELWGRLEPVSVGSATVWQPAPADQAVIMCAHAAKHCWSKLGWISDIAAFTRRHEHSLDWRDTVDRAGQLGGERLLLLGLRLAGDVLGADVPAEVVPRMRADTAVASLATELRQRLFAAVESPERIQGSYSAFEGGLLYIKSRERLQDKVPYAGYLVRVCLRRCTITPNHHDRAVLLLPHYLAFLYYLIRPIRLTRKYGIRLVQRCWTRPPVDDLGDMRACGAPSSDDMSAAASPMLSTSMAATGKRRSSPIVQLATQRGGQQ